MYKLKITSIFQVDFFKLLTAKSVYNGYSYNMLHQLPGGGLTEIHILYPKKSQLQNLSTQKNQYFS